MVAITRMVTLVTSVVIHVHKLSVFLSNFKQNWRVSTDFSKNFQNEIS